MGSWRTETRSLGSSLDSQRLTSVPVITKVTTTAVCHYRMGAGVGGQWTRLWVENYSSAKTLNFFSTSRTSENYERMFEKTNMYGSASRTTKNYIFFNRTRLTAMTINLRMPTWTSATTINSEHQTYSVRALRLHRFLPRLSLCSRATVSNDTKV